MISSLYCALQVLLDACQSKGQDIIIITTETDASGGPLMRHYLNVPPSPKTSSVSCMSPSNIILKTGFPNSPQAGNIFNFRGHGERPQPGLHSTPSCHIGKGQFSRGEIMSMFPLPAGQRGSDSCCSSRLTPLTLNSRPPRRQRVLSEPWPTIPDQAGGRFEETWRRRRSPVAEGGDEKWGGVGHQGGGDERTSRLGSETWRFQRGSLPRISQSLVSLTDPSHMTFGSLAHRKCLTPGGLRLAPRGESPPTHLRRNTLPSLQVTPSSSDVV